MTEPLPSESALPPEPAAKPTAGALLRAARVAQGLHVAALATAIKVTPRKLDALENDRLHELPDATFARALAQTICRYLKVDPQPVLALMPPGGMQSLEPTSRMQSTPYRDRAGRAEQGPMKSLGPLIWGAVVLLLAAAAVYLLPADWWGIGSNKVSGAPASSTVSTVVSSVPVLAPAASAGVNGTMPGASAVAGVPAVAAPLAQPGSLPAPAFAAAATSGADRATSAETVFSAPPPSAGAAPAVAGALVVTTTDASWVEVRDAKGQLLLSETVQPGRSIGLNGPLPLRLLVGNASATQLVFLGREVDVLARARDNVARFELR